MKYRCIKDIMNLGCLEVDKVYDVESIDKWGHTIYIIDKGNGLKAFLSEITMPEYFEKVES